jgi:hypothetical protein
MLSMVWAQHYDTETLSPVFQMALKPKARGDAQVSINNKGKYGIGKHVRKITFLVNEM